MTKDEKKPEIKEMQISLAEQIRLEKQQRADHCIRELQFAIKEVTQKHNCTLVMEMVISEQGARPQMTVMANDLK